MYKVFNLDSILNVKPSESEAVKKFRLFQSKFTDVNGLNQLGTKDLVKDIEV